MKRLGAIAICILLGMQVGGCKDEPESGTPTEDAGVEDTFDQDVSEDVLDAVEDEDVPDTSEDDVEEDAGPEDTGPDVDPDAEWYVGPEDDLFFVIGETREYTFSYVPDPGVGEVTLEIKPPLGVTATPSEIVGPSDEFKVRFETADGTAVSDSVRLEITGTNGVSNLDIFHDGKVRKPRIGQPDESLAPNGGAIVVAQETVSSQQNVPEMSSFSLRDVVVHPDDPSIMYLKYTYNDAATDEYIKNIAKVDGDRGIPSWGGTSMEDFFPETHGPLVVHLVDVDAQGRLYGRSNVANVPGGLADEGFLYRWTSTGNLDSSFGNDGIVNLEISDGEDGYWRGGVVFDDDVMVFGHHERACCADEQYPSYAKYAMDGSSAGERDMSFGAHGDGYAFDGRESPPVNPNISDVEQVLPLPNGEFIAYFDIGRSGESNHQRYSANGRPVSWSASHAGFHSWTYFPFHGLFLEQSSDPAVFAVAYERLVDFYDVETGENVTWRGFTRASMTEVPDDVFWTGETLVTIEPFIDWGNGLNEQQLNVYREDDDPSAEPLSGPADPGFNFGPGWEFRRGAKIVTANDTYAWLAGAMHKKRADGDFDAMIVVWRVWLKPWGE